VPTPVPAPTPPAVARPPDLLPGSYTAGTLHLATLQAPWLFEHSLDAKGPKLQLGPQLRLDSIGDCSTLGHCLNFSQAIATEAGHNESASWGRFTQGKVRIHLLLLDLDKQLQKHVGIHYLAGVPTVSMPTSGSARYVLTGATTPTFGREGTRPTGIFSGQGLVRFGPGTGTRIALEGQLSFGPDERYQMLSHGAGFDAQGHLNHIGTTNLRMTAPNTFTGQLQVNAIGNSDAMQCGSAGGNCAASVSGAFFGQQASQLGFGYTVRNRQRNDEDHTIQGVAVMHRVDTP
ncbi:MAG: hypothetical protein Q4B13_11840, partial [Lautropia sp.]|nr:hypothetical protein [Lautropia sp.]